ncbi:hypothetical protein Salat_0884300 [Sesamum alatum]|uniref:Uncharacterized protein n=1 Tax=Sesamum alatum TaxID=300844 RepID=A0AAE2CQY9_9LAMI|nr:hypothetical protein Salat_0884300 [Sesamum alatum]
MGDEHLVYFTYKQLPNFGYLCGRLGLIAKYCEIEAPNQYQVADRQFTNNQQPLGTKRGAKIFREFNSPTNSTTPRAQTQFEAGNKATAGVEVEQRQLGTVVGLDAMQDVISGEKD